MALSVPRSVASLLATNSLLAHDLVPPPLLPPAEAMWAANKLDINATLRHVCKKLLNDEQASQPALLAADSGRFGCLCL